MRTHLEDTSCAGPAVALPPELLDDLEMAARFAAAFAERGGQLYYEYDDRCESMVVRLHGPDHVQRFPSGGGRQLALLERIAQGPA